MSNAAMYSAEVLADSISPAGDRLTSIAVTYPHAVHKDMLRHRMHSRVVESFRARPTELLIEALDEGAAFKPDVFAKRIAGMGQGEELEEQTAASAIWELHVASCIARARELNELNIAKQQVNFVLQDLCPLVEIITATEWENFRGLRTETRDDGSPVARPEVFKAAEAILGALDNSEPLEGNTGWHLPLIDGEELRGGDFNDPEFWRYWAMVSAGRCARVSYDKHRDPEDPAKSIVRGELLVSSGHMSPFEMVARPFTEAEHELRERQRDLLRAEISKGDVDDLEIEHMIAATQFSGNFRGWHQMRKDIRNEDNYLRLKAAAELATA